MIAPLENNASYVAASETVREKRHSLRRVAGYLLPDERVKGCGCKRHSQTVDLVRSAKGAHFVGVETCGSVWHCPVCAARIAEKRRQEVAEAITGASEAGGAAYMLTLTIRHNRRDKLAYLKCAIADGWRKAQNRRAYRTFKAQHGVIGTIRAIEVTHGQSNGWHPHLHILFVTKNSFDEGEIAEVEQTLFDLWADVLSTLTGRYVALDALDFRPATTSDYVTKWGADRELVKGQQKEGSGSFSPWQLLAAFKSGNKRAGKLFQEYALAFKGAQQLTWSKGLKAHFDIGEVSDEQAAHDETEVAPDTLPLNSDLPEGRIGVLDRKAFDEVVRRSLTAQVLNIAHSDGWDGVQAFLNKNGITVQHTDSNQWRQPPEHSLPPHPKRYLKWDQKEFMRLGKMHMPGSQSTVSPDFPANVPGSTGGTPQTFNFNHLPAPRGEQVFSMSTKS